MVYKKVSETSRNCQKEEKTAKALLVNIKSVILKCKAKHKTNIVKKLKLSEYPLCTGYVTLFECFSINIFEICACNNF